MKEEPREYTHICRRCGMWFTNDSCWGGLCDDCAEDKSTSSNCKIAEFIEKREALKRRKLRDEEYAKREHKMTVHEEMALGL